MKLKNIIETLEKEGKIVEVTRITIEYRCIWTEGRQKTDEFDCLIDITKEPTDEEIMYKKKFNDWIMIDDNCSFNDDISRYEFKIDEDDGPYLTVWHDGYMIK